MQNNDTAMCENYLTDYTMNFSLNDCKPHGNQGYKRVLLQLFGYSGHGKSSFINTCKYVLDGREYLDYTDVSSFLVKKTTLRNSYPLTSNISLVDNRGFTTMNDQETGEIYAQLGNLLPLNKEVQWQKGYQDIMTRIMDHEADDDQSDFVVPIFIYSVKKGISQEEVPEIKTLLDNARNITGLIPTVVLTFKSQGKLTEVEETFRKIGIDHIFKLENFTQTDCTKSQSRHEEVLKFLCEVLKDVKYRMRDKRDPEEERTSRKSFVLMFTHKTYCKRVKDEN